MLGDHSYTGKLGDIEINPASAMTYNDGIYSTTLGAGAYNSGSLAAVTGALSIASGEDTKNTGATIYGSMNSIESATSSSSYSGVASSVLGFANRTENANAALIWGTGNEVTNSVEEIGIDTKWNKLSVAEAQQKAIEAMQSSKYAGGSVMAIGGGNKADYATYSQLTGVQNKVTGTEAKAAKYDFVNGYKNTVTEASDVTVIGSKNEVTADGNKVIGDNHKISGNNNVIFGSADKLTETTVNNSVVLGHNAKVTGEGGVALGFGSVADRGNAVSVGNAKLNRQITNVAAGTADTDAVNVSQLKKATANANKGWKLSTEGGAANQVASEATVDFSGKKDAGGHQNITVSNEGNNVKIDLASELHNITGVVNGKSRVTLGTGFAGITNGQASVIMLNGSTTINGVVGIDKTGKISGVANGEISATSKDAVNGSQLYDIKNSINTDISNKTFGLEDDNGNALKQKLDNTIKVKGADGITSTVNDGALEIGLKLQNNSNLVVDSNGLALNTALTGIQSITGAGEGAGSISFANGGNVNINNITFNNDGRIQNVADGKDTKDAVNVGQLNAVKETANKGWSLSTGKGEAVNVKPGETVDFSGDDNIKVSNTGKDVKVELEKDLTGIESISNGGVKLALNGAGGTAGLINGKGASVFLMNDSTVINGVVGIDKNGKITNVAAGTAATDAVNVSQLNKVATEAGKHTQVKAGTNVGVVPSETDGTNVYTVNADGTTVSGDSNVVVTAGAKDANNVTNYGVKLNKDLKGIESVSNGAAKLTLSSHPLFGATAELTNGKASVELKDSTTIINGKVQVRQDGSIGGVTAGRVDNDAVNLGQLKDVKAEALKHTTLSDGKNTTVEATVKDGQTDYKVNVAGDLTDITSVVNGGAKLALNGAAGYAGIVNGKGASVYLQDGYTKINNQVIIDQDGKISGVAAGTADTDAVNVSQLKKVSDTANAGWTLSTNGNATAGTKVTPGALVDFSGDNNVSVSNKGTAVSVKLNNALQDIESISNGDAKLALNGAAGYAGIINGQGASVYMQGSTTVINSKVSVDKDGKISGVAAGEVSSTSTDAINGSQLHQTNENVAALDKRVTQNEADIATNKANIAQNAADIAQNKADIAANRADIDKNKADIAQNKADIAQNKADIAQNKADIAQNKTDIKNLDNRVTNVEELAKKHTTVTAGDNITVTEDTNKDGGKEYKVALDKDIKLDSVTTGQTVMNNDGLKVGDKVSVSKDAVTAGKTSISDEGVKVGDKTYISDKGLNANGQQITNVADGKENGDAVNYGQLKGVENQVVSNTNRINQLGSRVNKVGAGAAALAALHPMDFDPDDKLTFSAGYGNYGGENAAAIGAYYRPDEKVMFSVGGTVGNGENMVNAGVSFSLDRTNHVSNSRTAMAREILDLRAEVTELKAMVAKGGLGSIAEDKMKIFPDVAENHWAYEYVGKLAAAGIIEGYPDGKFSGDRMMSRYEFAAMLYRAMQKGAQLDSKIINEFAPEMGRIRVDRISGEDGDRDKIERVRVNAVKGERDHYGNKVAKKAAK